LLFKLARRASKKAKKEARRARAKAEQAQIASRELTEQIAPATPLSARTRPGAPTPKRSAPNQSTTAATYRNRPARASKVGVNPPGAPKPQRPGQTKAVTNPMKAEAVARSTKRGPQTLPVANRASVESASTRLGALDDSKEPTGLEDSGEDRIRAVQASSESPAGNAGT
jgi:hypothetical protein